MKKRIIRVLSIFALCFLMIGVFTFEFSSVSANTAVGADYSASCLLRYKLDPNDKNPKYNFYKYLSNKYGNNISVEEHDKKMLANIYNLNQTVLNDEYKDRTGVEVNGTCANVACASLLLHYSHYDSYEINDKSENYVDTLVKVFANNLGQNYTTGTEGTPRDLMDDCVTATFDLFNNISKSRNNDISKSRYGDTNWFSLLGNINDALNGGVDQIIFCLTNHAVTVAGKTYFDITYTHDVEVGWWWWEKHMETQTTTVTEEFIIVCEGWGWENYALLPVASIGSTFDGQQVTWAIKR